MSQSEQNELIRKLNARLRVHELAAGSLDQVQMDLDNALQRLHDPHATNVIGFIGYAIVECQKKLAAYETESFRRSLELKGMGDMLAEAKISTLEAYGKVSCELQNSAMDMVETLRSQDATDEEKSMAYSTLSEILK